MTAAPVLVTGAGGFVCSEVALALRRAGHDVVATDQMFDAATATRLAGLAMVEGDLGSVLPGLGPCSAVVHGAAITASPDRLGISRAAHIRRNMDLLTMTLEFAQGPGGAARFVFISSMGVFEASDLPAPHGRFTEATRPTAACTYCAAKQAGEVLTASAAADGFATLSLRLGNIFGPHEAVRDTRQTLCLISRMIQEAKATGVITVETPDALREWSWLPDLADGIGHVLTAPWHAPLLHAGSPPVIGDLDLARAIADRIPATLRLVDPPRAVIRPPMASDVPGALQTVQWTAIETALDVMMPLEVAR